MQLKRKKLRPTRILQSPGWCEPVRLGLEKLLREGAGKQLPVVFDFDNTIVCGDIADATLAILTRSGKLSPSRLPKTFCPPFFSASENKVVTTGSSVDLTAYYEAFFAPTAHANDPAPLANGHAWAVEIMEGLSLLEIIEATRQAFEFGGPGEHNAKASTDGGAAQATRVPKMIEITPGKTAYAAPFFYPQMVELIAELVRRHFGVWIVSASPVWSVRWMVKHELNPRLAHHAIKKGIPPERVIGISTLLADRRNRLFKDSLLVREHAGYAALDTKVLKSLRLTSRFHFPVSTYAGKVACIFEQIGVRPWLGVGDSPGDHAFLSYSRHRLWLARLEKPAYQRALAGLIRSAVVSKQIFPGISRRWLIQPLLALNGTGFVQDWNGIRKLFRKVPAEVQNSIRILSTARHFS